MKKANYVGCTRKEIIENLFGKYVDVTVYHYIMFNGKRHIVKRERPLNMFINYRLWSTLINRFSSNGTERLDISYLKLDADSLSLSLEQIHRCRSKCVYVQEGDVNHYYTVFYVNESSYADLIYSNIGYRESRWVSPENTEHIFIY